jgi:carbonic anhydrase
MNLMTRRKFAGILGFVTANGLLKPASAETQHGNEKAVAAPPVAPKPASQSPAAAPKKPAAAPAKSVAAPVIPPLDRAVASHNELWQDLMEGNRRFASGKPIAKDFIASRARTAPGQHPYVAVLCCADSRVSPELIFDQSIGDLFVVRTAGNIADPIALGSLEYAIEHLGSRMLVVLGHERCGAVAAALEGEKMPTENLDAIVKKIKPGVDRLKGLVKGETLTNLAVEANIHHSAASVIEDSPIVHHELASGNLSIVKALYKIGTGEVLRLGGSFEDDAGPASKGN